MTATFNLWDEPWIEVRDLDGQGRAMSLHEVLIDSPRLRSIRGELPTQDAALLRLLVALLHRIYAVNQGGSTWATIWQSGCFDPDAVAGYGSTWHHRFDLLDPAEPFMQVAGLQLTGRKAITLAPLVADVPAEDRQFFTVRTLTSLASMDFAEAARWLVHAQAFDQSGIKSGDVDDPRVKGGKGYPIGTSWSGNLGLIILEGATLFETLMLNLVLKNEPDDSAVWERSVQGRAPERPDGAAPAGSADVLTWPSRRIRLIHDGGQVTGALVCNGVKLHPSNRYRQEMMTTWRRSPNQEKAQRLDKVYMPRKHLADRAIWRGLGPIIAAEPHGADTLRAGTLEQLASMRLVGVIADNFSTTLHAVGMEYGTQDSIVVDIFDDTISITADLVASPRLQQEVVLALTHTDQAAAAASALERNLAAAAGGESDGAQARRDVYEALRDPFVGWVALLDDHADIASLRRRWHDAVARACLDIAQKLIRGSGQPAWIGRSSGGRFINSSLAETYFYAALRKALPDRTPWESHV